MEHQKTDALYNAMVEARILQWAAAAQKPERCYLLELPAELRLLIYEYVFSDIQLSAGRRVTVVCKPYNKDLNKWLIRSFRRGKKLTSLLYTCRQIYLEACKPFHDRFQWEMYTTSMSPTGNEVLMEARDFMPAMRRLSITIREEARCPSRTMGLAGIQRLCHLLGKYGQRPHLERVRVSKVDDRLTTTIWTWNADVVEGLDLFAEDPAIGDSAAAACRCLAHVQKRIFWQRGGGGDEGSNELPLEDLLEIRERSLIGNIVRKLSQGLWFVKQTWYMREDQQDKCSKPRFKN
jgi:hypothetical protein